MAYSIDGNGFRIRGWRDVLAVLTIVALLAGSISSAVVWGIRMDGRTIENSLDIAAIQANPNSRADAFTGAEGDQLEQRIAVLEYRLDSMEGR